MASLRTARNFLRVARETSIALAVFAAVVGTALAAPQAHADAGRSVRGPESIVQRSLPGQLLSADEDGDRGTNGHPQDLPRSVHAGEDGDNSEWPLVGLAVVIAVTGALLVARRAR